mmetsp:Transcript_66827/g.178648  ORF Transcript_66827/g.178648 Transcript_66827/m.178648 type:complete len:320 (-) Transcript_66827:183-1142(-)
MYLDDAVYRSLVSEALEVKEAGRDKFLLWLHGAEEALLIKSRLLRAAQRERAMTLEKKLVCLEGEERTSAALSICRTKGLVEQGVNEPDRQGETPLMRAAGSGRGLGEIQLLAMARADVNLKGANGQAALHLAASYGHVATVEALASVSANIEADDNGGLTAMHMAAQCGSVEVLHVLKRLGANPRATNWQDSTPLVLAAQGGHLGAIRALVDIIQESGVGIDKDLNQALLIAARYCRVDAMDLLVSLGADVSKAEAEGSRYTALHYAAIGGYPAAIEWLVAKKGDLHALSSSGTTPLQEAQRCECEQAVSFLRRLLGE